MVEQTVLDPPKPASQPARRAKRAIFVRYNRLQMLVGVMVLAALVWSMWVTKILVTPKQESIVSARLSTIVGEYVQAQARSPSPPPQVGAEMRKFMASLDDDLQRRGSSGQIVFFGEEVLTRRRNRHTSELQSLMRT